MKRSKQMVVIGRAAVIARFNFDRSVGVVQRRLDRRRHQFEHVDDIGVNFAQTGGDVLPVADASDAARWDGEATDVDVDGVFEEFVDLRRAFATRFL